MAKYDPSRYAVDLGAYPCIQTETTPGPISVALPARASKHIRGLSGQVRLFPVVFESGKGCTLIDADGNRYIDFSSGIYVTNLGHCHPKVSEAAVAPRPHEIKGQCLYAYVTLVSGVEPSDELKKELITHIRKEIGPIATPDFLQFATALPKTRSGKIMRRILRKIAEGQVDNLGDTSTLADATVVETLIQDRQV